MCLAKIAIFNHCDLQLSCEAVNFFVGVFLLLTLCNDMPRLGWCSEGDRSGSGVSKQSFYRPMVLSPDIQFKFLTQLASTTAESAKALMMESFIFTDSSWWKAGLRGTRKPKRIAYLELPFVKLSKLHSTRSSIRFLTSIIEIRVLHAENHA